MNSSFTHSTSGSQWSSFVKGSGEKVPSSPQRADSAIIAFSSVELSESQRFLLLSVVILPLLKRCLWILSPKRTLNGL